MQSKRVGLIARVGVTETIGSLARAKWSIISGEFDCRQPSWLCGRLVNCSTYWR